MPDLTQGLEVVAVGIGGVFANLLLLMLVLTAVGAIFGRRERNPSGNNG